MGSLRGQVEMEFRRWKFLSDGAKDAMVAKAMCQARLGTVIVVT